MPKCRSCGKTISWIKTASGNMMPVEGDYITVTTNTSGRTKIVTDNGRVLTGDKVGDAYEGIAYAGRISHFATCPGAKDHRKGGVMDGQVSMSGLRNG